MRETSALPAWRKSNHSGSNNGDCLEVSDAHPAHTPVRGSKNPTGPALLFGTATWSTFVASIRMNVIQPTPTTVTGYAVPQQLANALVRLGKRLDRQEDALRQIDTKQKVMVDVLRDIAQTLRRPNDRTRTVQAPELTPEQLLSNWKSRNLTVTEDVHTVAAHLAPALLHGGADYRVEEIAVHTGLTPDRVSNALELLSEHGCVRQVGRAPDGAPFYVLP
ncbi:DUF397 domain-containing protein [Streptomyces sp. ME02-8801-2C]|uniref:DUF397 domain-containing protein n=1 Tax=Streptomyces sp. ME02-8801-2C TaxID=3028680 RepID=UPI0029C00509|nr:DUF397 domain-containing protein [Streptomyces sp. ME02-8801-2C]